MSSNAERNTRWGIAIFVTGLGWLVHSMLRRIMPGLFSSREVSLETPLSAFEASSAVDRAFGGETSTESISKRYERMCVLDPVAYKNDPAIPEVLTQYRKLLRGEIVDREGRHAPSDKIEGVSNEDYRVYLEAQLKVLGRVEWMENELRRIEGIVDVEDLRVEYGSALLKLGVPENIVPAMLTDERLNTYTADEWRAAAIAVKAYAKDHKEAAVQEFLLEYPEKEITLNSAAMEIYAVMSEYDIPTRIIDEIVRGRLTPDQGRRVLSLVEERGYEWDEAFESVLHEDQSESELIELRAQYRNATR
ncbi:MAG: hypothetical protein GF334_01085 [Candidatus Altiarchaeales archaeon]|nr:hypothetical protein [Candidatus Altiarchaeales archaeon]